MSRASSPPWYGGQADRCRHQGGNSTGRSSSGPLSGASTPRTASAASIRVLVKTSEEKRQVRNHWDAFVLDQPKLKAMVQER